MSRGIRSDERGRLSESNHKRRDLEIYKRYHEVRPEERSHPDNRSDGHDYHYKRNHKSTQGREKYEHSREIRSDDCGHIFERNHGKQCSEMKEKYRESRNHERRHRHEESSSKSRNGKSEKCSSSGYLSRSGSSDSSSDEEYEYDEEDYENGEEEYEYEYN